MSKVKLNLAEFIAAFPEHATITDFVKYNWTTAEYAPATDPLVGTWERNETPAQSNSKWFDADEPAGFIAVAPSWVSGVVYAQHRVDGTEKIEIYDKNAGAWVEQAIGLNVISSLACNNFFTTVTAGLPSRTKTVVLTEEAIAEAKTLTIDGEGGHSLYDLWQVAFPYWFTKE